jgi:hypothetical protein
MMVVVPKNRWLVILAVLGATACAGPTNFVKPSLTEKPVEETVEDKSDAKLDLTGAQVDNVMQAWREVQKFAGDVFLRDFEIRYKKTASAEAYITFSTGISKIEDTANGRTILSNKFKIFGVLVSDQGARIVYTGDD